MIGHRILSSALRRLAKVVASDETIVLTEETAAQARSHEEQLRRRKALEINDNVVQGLTVAKYALDAGDYEEARQAIEQTLEAARHIITDLLDEGPEDLRLLAGDLVRLEPATVVLNPRE